MVRCGAPICQDLNGRSQLAKTTRCLKCKRVFHLKCIGIPSNGYGAIGVRGFSYMCERCENLWEVTFVRKAEARKASGVFPPPPAPTEARGKTVTPFPLPPTLAPSITRRHSDGAVNNQRDSRTFASVVKTPETASTHTSRRRGVQRAPAPKAANTAVKSRVIVVNGTNHCKGYAPALIAEG